MPCYFPINGYHAQPSPELPRGGFTTKRSLAFTDKPLTVSCGQCIGCRLERSRQWAVRCVHESTMHADNCFITLTYNDDTIPYGDTLKKSDFQKFMKRLRKNRGQMRFFHCGEYGDETRRPHYHACIFGWSPDDPELFSTNGEHKLFTSPTLTEIWGLGHATFGELTFDTAAYTARYVTKKVTGPQAENHYQIIDPDTGEITNLQPEYCTMSRRPGIGLPWLKKFGLDSYSKDEIILRDRAMKPPRAYDRQFEVTDPQLWRSVRSNRARLNHLRHHPVNLDPNVHHSRRQHAGNIIAKSKLKLREIKP